MNDLKINQNDLIASLFARASEAVKSNSNLEEFSDELQLGYLIRCVELSFLDLFSNAKISGTVHTCVGQEMIGVAIAKYLQNSDWVTSNHRCHGHFIAKTGNWRGLIDELIGLNTGVSRGIGSSQHLLQGKFISNGTQGSLLPVATGLGVAEARKRNSSIVVSFIGEGTFGEGVLYEAMNLSAVFSSPHLIVCENNYYSQTTPQASALSGSISNRAEAFGYKCFDSSTWQLTDLFDKCKLAINYVRSNKRPAFLKIDTYRLLAHSKGDDDRSNEEVDHFRNLDLIERFVNAGNHTDLLNDIKNEVAKYVDSKLLAKGKFPLKNYVRDELPRKVSMRISNVANETSSMAKSLNRAYKKQLMQHDAIFLGEDIADPYGGAFKITKGFQTLRPANVYSTPISEAGLVGMSIGMNLAGEKTFAEIMFGDFVVNAMDQLVNNASKFHHMYGKQISCDVVVRTPMGGRRGYGPTHSQSLEKLVLGIDNLAVFAPTSLLDPKDLIDGLNRTTSPKLVIENKTDYSCFLYQQKPNLKLSRIGGSFGTLRLSPNGAKPSIVLLAFGYLARLIADNYEEIFQKSDQVFILFCPQLLHPLPVSHFLPELKKIQRILVLDEGSEAFGWADGAAAAIRSALPTCQIDTLSSAAVPIPSGRELEESCLISINKIITKLWQMEPRDD